MRFRETIRKSMKWTSKVPASLPTSVFMLPLSTCVLLVPAPPSVSWILGPTIFWFLKSWWKFDARCLWEHQNGDTKLRRRFQHPPMQQCGFRYASRTKNGKQGKSSVNHGDLVSISYERDKFINSLIPLLTSTNEHAAASRIENSLNSMLANPYIIEQT